MDSVKAKRRSIRKDIKRLHRAVEDHQSEISEFFESSDLSRLGILATQVALSASADGAERIQFDPCYFEPLSAQIIRDHPLTDPEQEPISLSYYTDEEEELGTDTDPGSSEIDNDDNSDYNIVAGTSIGDDPID